MNWRYWGKTLIKPLQLNKCEQLQQQWQWNWKKWHQNYLLRGQSMLASDYVVTQAMWGQRLKARWHLSTWVASHVDTWVHKQARHIDRWESCKHSRDVGMWAREHRSHVGTWACKHARQVSTQDTLAREHISTQGTWACFQDAEHAI